MFLKDQRSKIKEADNLNQCSALKLTLRVAFFFIFFDIFYSLPYEFLSFLHFGHIFQFSFLAFLLE